MRRALWGAVGVPLLAAVGYEIAAHGGATAWTAPLGLLGPDLAFLVGAGTRHEPGAVPRRTVPVYNLLHLPVLPLVLLLVVGLDGQSNAQAAPYVVAALAWLAHIAVDRACGFRLRARDGSIRHTARPAADRRRAHLTVGPTS